MAFAIDSVYVGSRRGLGQVFGSDYGVLAR